MAAFPLTRRAALAALGALALPPVVAVRSAMAQPGLRIRAIKVDVSPIRASMGDPTAAWVQEALPGALAQALAPYMSPGDRGGATLVARIDYLYLGVSGGGPGFFHQTQDTINGTLLLEMTARRRDREGAAEGDFLLFPDGGRSGPGRAGLVLPRDGPCAGVCRLGAERAAALNISL